jgi:hypothetical protein
MNTFASIHTARGLANALSPHLARIDQDNDLQGSVVPRIEAFLEATPVGRAVTDHGIQVLQLDETSAAYLVFRQWVRSQPAAFNSHVLRAKTLAQILEAAASRLEMPTWLHGNEGAVEKDDRAVAPKVSVRKAGYVDLAELTGAEIREVSGVQGVTIQLLRPTYDQIAELEFVQSSDGWGLRCTSGVFALDEIPATLLTSIETRLARMTPEAVSGEVARLRRLVSNDPEGKVIQSLLDAIREYRGPLSAERRRALVKRWDDNTGQLARVEINALAATVSTGPKTRKKGSRS